MSVSSTETLQARIAGGDLRALARAATLVESQSAAGKELISAMFPQTGNAITIGVTGPPGAGKSTLVDRFTSVLRGQRKTVGIIAVDPSSPFSHGALLGDRIRMQQHHGDPGVFIRSMATRGKLGGVAQTTLDIALLLDAAGRDYVLIETVGVGQDEIEVARLADITAVVLVPGMGDDVQAIKAGIMEVADVFAINKADLAGADRLEQEIRAMQSIADEAGRANAAPIRRVIASEGEGIGELLNVITALFEKQGRQGRRAEVWELRLREMLREDLIRTVPEELLRQHASLVADKREDPYSALSGLREALWAAR